MPNDGLVAPLVSESRACYAGFATRQLTLDGAGPCIVLLHGFSHSSECWRPLMAELAKTKNAAIAVDLPGFGTADPLRPGPLLPQLDEFVSDLVMTIGKREPVILVGNSLGGTVAVRAAMRELPIGGLVPIDVPGFGWTPLTEMVARLNFAPLKLLGHLSVPAAIGEPVAARLMYGTARTADPDMVRLTTDQLRGPGRRQFLQHAAQFAAEVKTTNLGPIVCPTTVVHGRRDRIVSLSGSRSLHEAIPGSRLTVLDDAGHCPQLDATETIASIATDHAALTHVQSKPA